MNRIILANAGVDYNEGVRRFSNDKQVFEKFLSYFLTDPNFKQIKPAIDSGDLKKAFSCAHSLKGVAGNLSLVKLHSDLIPLVEELRYSRTEHLDEYYRNVETSYNNVCKAITQE